MSNLLELCKNLERKIDKLEARIEELEAENKALRIENPELKERLGLNSKNSSIPSSKEGIVLLKVSDKCIMTI